MRARSVRQRQCLVCATACRKSGAQEAGARYFARQQHLQLPGWVYWLCHTPRMPKGDLGRRLPGLWVLPRRGTTLSEASNGDLCVGSLAWVLRAEPQDEIILTDLF